MKKKKPYYYVVIVEKYDNGNKLQRDVRIIEHLSSDYLEAIFSVFETELKKCSRYSINTYWRFKKLKEAENKLEEVKESETKV